MANLKDIRTRISSVKSTMQITNAMKMVSAAKLKKAQEAIESMRPYAEKLNELLVSLSQGVDSDVAGAYAEIRSVKKVLVVLITSNRGLCGALNSNAIKEAKKLLDNYRSSGIDADVLTIGKRGYDALKKEYNIIDNRSDVYEKNFSYDKIISIAENIMQQYVNKEYDKVILVYNEFINPGLQKPVSETFLPIEKQEEQSGSDFIDYIFEPSQEEIVRELIPKSLKTRFFRAIREAWASEHGARMTAMHKATDNAKEMVEDLTLQYNKARQAVITGEILEIVSGAEALKNQG